MQIVINYYGDIGHGLIEVELPDKATVLHLLRAFHDATETNDYFELKGGAPPNRRQMKVTYDYYINQVLIKDGNKTLSQIRVLAGDKIILKVTKGNKVD